MILRMTRVPKSRPESLVHGDSLHSYLIPSVNEFLKWSQYFFSDSESKTWCKETTWKI